MKNSGEVVHETASGGQNYELQRKLNSRLMSMIALGGAIGTGLFLSTGYSVHAAGPGGALVAYGIIAFMVYFIMAGLTEMATYMPVSGSFETYSSRYVDPALGFAAGWNYWFSWAICLGVEVVAGAILMQYWFPDSSPVLWSALFLLLITGLNLLSVRVFGEAEFYFAGIKVTTVIIFLIIGALMVFGIISNGDQQGAVGLANYLNGKAFPNGITGILQVGFAVSFSLMGTELLGIAAGESAEPEVTIPKANKSLIWRLILFYVGAVFIVGCIIPYQDANVDTSVFTIVFQKSGIPYADDIMNFVIITSVLSCANSGTYCASRLLYALSKEGKAPKIFSKVGKRGIPYNALIVTCLIGCFAFLSNFYAASTVYIWLLSASGMTGFFTWFFISFTHLRFRKIYAAEHGGDLSGLKYKAPWYPAGSVLACIICGACIFGTLIDPASRMSVYLGIPAFALLWIGYKLKYKTKFVRVPQGGQNTAA